MTRAKKPVPLIYSSAFTYVLAIVLVALGGVTTEIVVEQKRNELESQEKARVYSDLSALRAELEASINSTLHLARGVVAYVATHPDIDSRDFKTFARAIIADNPSIRNIGLAPDNVIRFVYPLAGNENALGLAYANMPTQWAAVERAIALRSSVVAGPVNLVQGGRGVISRTPVFIEPDVDAARDAPGRPAGASNSDVDPSSDYWGIVSIVVDVDGLFAHAGDTMRSLGLELALRGIDGLGEDGGMILGREALFAEDSVQLPVSLPNGAWQMAGQPSAGWIAGDPELIGARIAGYSLTALVAGFAILLVSLVRSNRTIAHVDHLTGLANRRQILEVMGQYSSPRGDGRRSPFTVFYADLNGFKPINDRYGHATGDLVLIETARRLRADTRATDTVARLGGDEFIVIVPGRLEADQINHVREKLKAAIEVPFELGEASISVGSSIGWARFPDDGYSVQDMLDRADERMYRTKRGELEAGAA